MSGLNSQPGGQRCIPQPDSGRPSRAPGGHPAGGRPQWEPADRGAEAAGAGGAGSMAGLVIPAWFTPTVTCEASPASAATGDTAWLGEPCAVARTATVAPAATAKPAPVAHRARRWRRASIATWACECDWSLPEVISPQRTDRGLGCSGPRPPGRGSRAAARRPPGPADQCSTLPGPAPQPPRLAIPRGARSGPIRVG